MTFHLAEIAAIVAALQLFRDAGYGSPDMYRWLDPKILSIANWSYRVDPLEDAHIDQLIARLKQHIASMS